MARHTFATTITLEHDVPIETVSQMLGHKSIKTTQIYAKVSQQKVSENMRVLKERLNVHTIEQRNTIFNHFFRCLPFIVGVIEQRHLPFFIFSKNCMPNENLFPMKNYS
jgi:hypothetical protein